MRELGWLGRGRWRVRGAGCGGEGLAGGGGDGGTGEMPWRLDVGVMDLHLVMVTMRCASSAQGRCYSLEARSYGISRTRAGLPPLKEEFVEDWFFSGVAFSSTLQLPELHAVPFVSRI